MFRLLQEVVEVVEEIITDGAIQLLDAGQADEIAVIEPDRERTPLQRGPIDEQQRLQKIGAEWSEHHRQIVSVGLHDHALLVGVQRDPHRQPVLTQAQFKSARGAGLEIRA